MKNNLVQCQECNGWLSPKAVWCPTCGISHVHAVPRDPKQNQPSGWSIGWKIVKAFWAAVVILAIFAVLL